MMNSKRIFGWFFSVVLWASVQPVLGDSCGQIQQEYRQLATEYETVLVRLALGQVPSEGRDHPLLVEVATTGAVITASRLVSQLEQLRLRAQEAQCIMEFVDLDPDPEAELKKRARRYLLVTSDPFPARLVMEGKTSPEVFPSADFDYEKQKKHLELLKKLEHLKEKAKKDPSDVKKQLQVLTFLHKNKLPFSFAHQELFRLVRSETIRVIPPWVCYYGETSLSTGDAEQIAMALALVRKFQKFYPNDASLVLVEAKILHRQGKLTEVIDVVYKLQQRGGKTREIQWALARLLVEYGETDLAAEVAARLEELLPEYQIGFFLLTGNKQFWSKESRQAYGRVAEQIVANRYLNVSLKGPK